MKTFAEEELETRINNLDEYEREIALSCFASIELINELKKRILENENAKSYVNYALLMVDSVK